MKCTFNCYNSPKQGGVIYLCDESPDVYGLNAGLVHSRKEAGLLCEYLASERCSLRGPLRHSVSSVNDNGVEVYTVTVEEVREDDQL